MNVAAIETAAAGLFAAQRDRNPVAPITQRYSDIDVRTAYAIQQVNLQRRLHGGARLVGRKIGLTSAPMQQLLGVDEPDYGFILDDMVIHANTLDRNAFCQPRAEPEVAFLLHTALRGPGVTTAEVYAATQAVAAALEIVDSRIADWKLTLADTVADNASSGAVILGNWIPYSDAVDLPAAVATLSLNGVEVDTGTGAAVMGDPGTAVAWLANALADYGTELSAGQFVMSGSFTSAVFVDAGDEVATAISTLGSVSLTFT